MEEFFINNIKWLIIQISVLIFLLSPPGTYAQTREYLLKAGYIEKFTHFIEWPEAKNVSDNSNKFLVAVIGENKYGNTIERIFDKVKVKNKIVQVRYIRSVSEIDNCMILIISGIKKNQLEEILNYTSGKPILTIGDTKGYGKKGVLVNLFIDDNFIRYEINRSELDKSDLKVSSLLLTSAKIVKTDE